MSRPVLAALALVLVAPVTLASVQAASAPVARESDSRGPVYTVVARLDRAEVIADRATVHVTGRVRPRAPGRVVVLQQRREDSRRWTATGTARIGRDGTYRLHDRPSRAGVRYYRVLKPASDGHRAAKSDPMRLSVWAWKPLSELPAGAHAGVLFGQQPRVATRPYPGSIVLETSGNPGFVEYTVGGRCLRLEATYAVTDDSASGSTGRVTTSVDGTVTSEHTVYPGTLVKNDTDLRDAFRFRFDLQASLAPAGWAAVGSPRVLCLD